MVYLLTMVAALVVAGGEVIQQRYAAQAPPEYNLSPRLLLWLVRRPRWLAGVGCTAAGNGVFAAALGGSSVALVEALFVVRLVFALGFSAAWVRQRVPARDWLGAVAITGGLAAFILTAQPRKGAAAAANLQWVLAGGAIVVLAGALAAVARPLGPARKAVLLGAGAGALYGLQAALIQSAVHELTGSGMVALLATWNLYCVIAVALLGMLLMQSAYEAAPLPASYPAVVTTELLAGIAVGVWVLQGSIRLNPISLAITVAGLAAMIAGIYLLTTSPLVTGQLDQLVRQQEVGLARQLEARLERELRRANRDAARAARRLQSAPARNLRRLDRELRRIDSGIQRLCRLQEDIQRHRKAELERLERLPAEQQRVLRRQDRELSAQERTIDERAHQLREDAELLKARTHREAAPEERSVG